MQNCSQKFGDYKIKQYLSKNLRDIDKNITNVNTRQL